MKKLLLALPILLGGCATFSLITGSSVSPQAAIAAANAFDAIEPAATVYLRLPPCGPTVAPTCRNAAAVAKLVPAIRSGRVARNQLEALLTANGGAAIPIATYNTLEAAITTLQAVNTQFNISK